MTTEPTSAPDPIRRDQLPCIPPPEFEFRTVLAARPDGQPGCFLLPGDLGPVVVRRRVTYGDWEPVRPDRWADAPTSVGTSGAIANGTGGSVGTGPDLADWNSADDASYDPPAPAPGDGRGTFRDRLCDAFVGLIRENADRSVIAPGAMADTALAVRDWEMERLRGEVARQVDAKIGVAGQWGNAIVDLGAMRTRAETAEAAAATALRDGAREAAAMLRRTPRDSRDYPAVLTGARVIEDWLRAGTDGAPR